jgi:hypothetical protein
LRSFNVNHAMIELEISQAPGMVCGQSLEKQRIRRHNQRAIVPVKVREWF